MTADIAHEGRDAHGKFAPGNRCGKGNIALRRLGELQAAVRDAIGVDGIREVLVALQGAAADGDAQAASVLLAHVCGRPREAQLPVDVDIGAANLSTASGIVEALTQIVRGAASGDVQVDVAERLANLVGRVAEAGALLELEKSVRRLESREVAQR